MYSQYMAARKRKGVLIKVKMLDLTFCLFGKEGMIGMISLDHHRTKLDISDII